MGMGQLNPMRTIAPQQTVSTSALAQILGNQGKAIQSIGKGLTGLGDTAGEFGRQQNTSKLTDLIARSQIDDLGADEIRNIASEEGIDTSRLTDSGSVEFAKLIERKDAFAKTKGGVILKDGTFKSLTGEEGVVPEDVRDDAFYAGWKSPDKTFDRALQGTTLQNRKTLIDGYLDGQTSAKELFKNDNKGVPRSTGFTFMYKNKPTTATKLKDELAKQNAIANNPSETPIKKEQAKLEIKNIEQTVAEQNNIEEQNIMVSRLIGQGNSTKVTSISNQDARFHKPTLREQLMGKQNSVSKDSTSANTLFNGTNNGKADSPDHISQREGFRATSYVDSTGNLTGGTGHKLTKAEQLSYPEGTKIPKQVTDRWEKQDRELASKFANAQAKDLGINNKEFIKALQSVNFQLGNNWKSKFPTAYKNLKDGNFTGAINEIKYTKKGSNEHSDWMKQTPVRVNDFIKAIQKLM